ncbi:MULTISPECIES: DUF397 domain-containing protein [Nocardia]|uniref:DUF397 domain-containing protein n=1 Tax=Nocardia sputorum TaxID=2984338 RepID=A0ABN6TYG6_9NOCA|nr:DUF397 domain-containing protein [Nocardia sputorum]BDT96212.1 DUF397 domain-containing protein [Nocardia sputorum]BDT97972.1 DUF397 domain-containing protein [Nocardia sputorum]
MIIDLSGAKWFKSVHSGEADQCVEIAWLGAGHVGVRDSKNPAGPALIFTPGQWSSFTACITAGAFDPRSDL